MAAENKRLREKVAALEKEIQGRINELPCFGLCCVCVHVNAAMCNALHVLYTYTYLQCLQCTYVH